VDAVTPAGCEVYWARLDELQACHLELLDDVERARRNQYAREDDRARFALGAVLLRLVVARRLGVAPRRVRVDRTCDTCGSPHGRPRMLDGSLALSVTHSGELVAVAVSTAGDIGIDVEIVRPLDYVPLIAEVCAPDEACEVTDARAFFVYWTRKESVLKATGAGLALAMRTLTVTPPSQPPRLLRYPRVPPLLAQMVDLMFADGYAGAATVLSCDPVVVRTHDAIALLRG
jgi:4'-phosphopantetheinyl transferase